MDAVEEDYWGCCGGGGEGLCFENSVWLVATHSLCYIAITAYVINAWSEEPWPKKSELDNRRYWVLIDD